MGYYRNIVIEVDELHFEGLLPIEIAERTGLSFEEVIEILAMLEETA